MFCVVNVKSVKKRQEIIKAASEVFRELGFERASMSKICTRYIFTKRFLHFLYPSKLMKIRRITISQSGITNLGKFTYKSRIVKSNKILSTYLKIISYLSFLHAQALFAHFFLLHIMNYLK